MEMPDKRERNNRFKKISEQIILIKNNIEIGINGT
jgi:hypothetical protein